METNWNQLIERYLQNELSEEGRSAFEQELQLNPELREELEMHQLIQSAAKRASQRTIIQQTGKSYLRNLRVKQFTIGVVVAVVAIAGIIYWTQSNKQQKTNEPNSELVVINSEEDPKELVCRAYQINNQPNQTGDKSSLIQSSDWQMVVNDQVRSAISFTSLKGQNGTGKGENNDAYLKYKPITFKEDTVNLPRPKVAVLGYTNEKLNGEVIESQTISSLGKNMGWTQKYDSIGKFNELYCGYALVMDKSKFGFVDPNGKVFIPLIYDQIVVTANIKSSKQKNKLRKKKVLYIPKRSGKEVKDCEEIKVFMEVEREPAEYIKSK